MGGSNDYENYEMRPNHRRLWQSFYAVAAAVFFARQDRFESSFAALDGPKDG